MNDPEIHFPTDGVNLDVVPNALHENQMSFAQDNDSNSNIPAQDLCQFPYASSLNIYSIPDLQAQYQYVRLNYNQSFDGYRYIIYDESGNLILDAVIAIGVNLTTHIASINTALSATSYTVVTTGSPQGKWFVLSLRYATNTPVVWSVDQYSIDATLAATQRQILVFTLQEAFNPLGSVLAQFIPLQAFELNNIHFVLSKSFDETANQLGYAIEDQSGDWSYTTLFISRQFNFPLKQVIEVQGESISSNQYALYWCDDTNKDKVIYVPTSLGIFSVLKYTMSSFDLGTSGLFTLESIGEQTNQQIQNPSRPSFDSQLESGGGLESGIYWYITKLGVSSTYSEWSVESQPIPVFKASTTAPSAGAYIGGDKSPVVTSKVNVIRIKNANARIYNTITLGAIICQGGAYAAVIVGEYDLSANEFTLTHTGLENTAPLDVASIPAVQSIILRSKSHQLKKNRLNKAKVEVANDANLESITQAVTLGQVTENIGFCGVVDFTGSPLFRASISAPYNDTDVGSQRIKLFDDATPPNFVNASSFNNSVNVWAFTAPSTGPYSISISIDIQPGNDSSGVISGATSIYALNTTVPGFSKYCVVSVANDPRALLSGPYSSTQTVTLTIGDVVCFSGDFTYLRPPDGSGSPYRINGAVFTATEVISDYPQKSLAVGEYQLPINVATKTGYMVNETYPFYCRFYYKNGYVSSWYYMGNKRFDGGGAYATLPNGYLTTSATLSTVHALAYGLTINGLDLSTIKNDVYRVEIGRGICNPTILGTGVVIPAHGTIGGTDGGLYKTGLYAGDVDGASPFYGNHVPSGSNLRYFGNMICPDWIDGEKPTFQVGDYLIVYGTANYSTNSSIIAGADSKFGAFREYRGAFIPFAGNPIIVSILDGQYTTFDTNSGILKNDTATQYLGASLNKTGTIDTMATECMAMTFATKILPVGWVADTDTGVYYIQYVRPVSNQYDSKNTTVVSTGTFVEISGSTPNVLPQITVFGGDTYTQKTYVKILYNALNAITPPTAPPGGTISSFIGFYSQNKINQQLRFVDKLFKNLPFPFGTTLSQYLFGTYDAQEQFQIDAGYTWKLPVKNQFPYNSKIPKPTNFGARIYYSEEKPIGSLIDWYRIVLPLNFKDLSASDGDIVSLFSVSAAEEIMLAIQPTAVTVLPYEQNVALSASDGSVYIGNGAVYARTQNKISTFGASIKTGTILAKNESGNSQAYWINERDSKALFRYGGDGIINLFVKNGWRTFGINNFNFIQSEFDVVMGYDINRKCLFVTARAVNTDIPEWNDSTPYVLGNKVRYGDPNKYHNFENLQDVYIALGGSTDSNPYSNPSDWQYQSQTDNNTYYNRWSFVWNEGKNHFKGFFSFLPERYFQYNGRLIVPHGKADYGLMFDLFGGSLSTPLQWLNSGSNFKQGTFILEFVGNKNGAIPKRWLWGGLQVGSDHDINNNPSLLIYTDTQTSESTGLTQFEFSASQLAQGIFEDSNNNSLVSPFVKFKLSTQAYYKLFAVAIHSYLTRRNIFK